MRYVNKILILRFLNILLIIWLIFQFDKIFDQISRWREEFRKLQEEQNEEKENIEYVFYFGYFGINSN